MRVHVQVWGGYEESVGSVLSLPVDVEMEAWEMDAFSPIGH